MKIALKIMVVFYIVLGVLSGVLTYDRGGNMTASVITSMLIMVMAVIVLTIKDDEQ